MSTGNQVCGGGQSWSGNSAACAREVKRTELVDHDIRPVAPVAPKTVTLRPLMDERPTPPERTILKIGTMERETRRRTE